MSKTNKSKMVQKAKNCMLPLQTACCHCCWLRVLMQTRQNIMRPNVHFFHTHPFRFVLRPMPAVTRESGIIIMFALIPFLTHVRLNSICKDALLDLGIAIYSYSYLYFNKLQGLAFSSSPNRSPWFDATF